MSMIWSSLARNRSFDPLVSCFFGRIVPSDAAQNHAVRFARTPKMKLQASATLSLETLQSRVNLCAQNRLSLRHLAALHGRLLRLRCAKLRGMKAAPRSFKMGG